MLDNLPPPPAPPPHQKRSEKNTAAGWKDALQSCGPHAAHMSSIWWSSDSRLRWERRVRERRRKKTTLEPVPQRGGLLRSRSGVLLAIKAAMSSHSATRRPCWEAERGGGAVGMAAFAPGFGFAVKKKTPPGPEDAAAPWRLIGLWGRPGPLKRLLRNLPVNYRS